MEYSCLHNALHNRFFKNLLGCVGSCDFSTHYQRLCCNQGCKVIQITNIEAMKGTRCSHKGIFSCPIILIIGKKVVHSVKTVSEISLTPDKGY